MIYYIKTNIMLNTISFYISFISVPFISVKIGFLQKEVRNRFEKRSEMTNPMINGDMRNINGKKAF